VRQFRCRGAEVDVLHHDARADDLVRSHSTRCGHSASSRGFWQFFELAPDARRLFTSDMDKQQLKLMDAIAATVGVLDQREMFQSTGRRARESRAGNGFCCVW
jgi:hypothetical protein